VSGSASSWFEQLEAKLEQQLEAFLRDNPSQEALLQEQEQQDRARHWRERRLALQQQAEGLRAELLELAAEIQRWQERVNRARQAGAADLADRADAHRNGLMEQGRQRWQLLVALGEALAELEAGLQQEAAASGVNQGRRQADAAPSAQHPQPDDLDQAWARFEADQELEQLRRRQRG
jgi:hercynine metabolism protein